MIGYKVSHYQILEKLGEGGMGVVYKARDTHLDRFVAIKVLPAEKVADPERKMRFVQEAKTASALNHPNICTIFDIAVPEGKDSLSVAKVRVNSGKYGQGLKDSWDRFHGAAGRSTQTSSDSKTHSPGIN